MKVLWFTNTPCASVDAGGSSSVGGGWLVSLDRAVQDKVDLHVAFYSCTAKEDFKVNKTDYYPIEQSRTKLRMTIDTFVCVKKIANEDTHKFMEIIDRVRPDIIHIHGTENPFVNIVGRVDVPVVVSIQGNIAVYYHKYCSGIEKRYLKTIDIGHITAGLFPLWRVRKTFYWKRLDTEATGLSQCRNIIGRTDWDRRITSVMAPKSRYFSVSEILRKGFYDNRWSAHKRDKLIIHTTNSDNPYKGFETICRAASLLNGLGINFEWNIAGISSNGMVVKAVKRMLKDKYPTKGLNLMGNLGEHELITALLNADIYVMSSHIENSPNNLSEAMILGLPCISTFAGGSGSILTDKQDGILIQDGDPWAMAGAILELHRNPQQAQIYGDNACRNALHRHNTQIIISNLLDTYKNITDDKQ